jgi:hypothetical protein
MNITTTISIAAAALVAALLIVLSYQNRRLFYRCPTNQVVQPFVASPQNDKTLVVIGWSESELGDIIEDFSNQYQLPTSVKYLVRTEGEMLKVAFPEDIEPDLFVFLVNYVQYPKNLDAKNPPVTSVGTATLSSDFQLPSPALVGKHATFYIPADDKEYDLLYVRVSGDTYENEFGAKCWRAVKEARIPAAVLGLI